MWTAIINEPPQVLICTSDGLERTSLTNWHRRMGGWRGAVQARLRGARMVFVHHLAFDPHVPFPIVKRDVIGRDVLHVGTDVPLVRLGTLGHCSDVRKEMRLMFARDECANLAAMCAVGQALLSGVATARINAA